MKDRIYAFLDRKITIDMAITACCVTFLVTLVLVAGWLAILTGGWTNLKQTVKFGQILSVVDRVYIGEADMEAVTDTAFETVIDSLGDRWSSYLTAEEYDRYMEAQSNQYTGIGITIRNTAEGWQIIGVAEASPAQKAGITAEGYLVEVNGVRLTEESSGEIAALMQSDPKHVTVVTADAEGKEQTFTMELEKIYSNPVSYSMMDGDIGYIVISNFDETCADSTIAAVEALREQGARGLLFDVRNNGGGYVKELTEILDYLLPEGDIFVSVDHTGEETVTKSDADFVDMPMAVLVNEHSYSAAEFFPAALQEYGAATIVGAQTTGKNRSQTNYVLLDGSAVHISSKRYLTPHRVDLTVQGGLTPDVLAQAGEGDPQLKAALAVFD